MAKKETEVKGHAIALSDEWLAIILTDGRILLQHRAQAMDRNGDVYNLNKLTPDELGTISSQSDLFVRSLLLHPNGEVSAESGGGISANGIPSESDSFILLESSMMGFSQKISTHRHKVENHIETGI